jgi:hypothetical protein
MRKSEGIGYVSSDYESKKYRLPLWFKGVHYKEFLAPYPDA